MSLIGKNIVMTGYGTLHTCKTHAKVLRVTKLYVILAFGDNDAKGSRYRLRDGYPAGEWQWSGYEIPTETLVQIRDEAPGRVKLPDDEIKAQAVTPPADR